MSPVPTLELHSYPRRAGLMATAACIALVADFASKELVVALAPDSLIFNVLGRVHSSADARLILVAAACSLLACVLPVRAAALGAGLALGGALGNLASRPRSWATHDGTPDFIPFADGTVGNVADVFIAAGVLTMVVGMAVWLVTSLAARPHRTT